MAQYEKTGCGWCNTTEAVIRGELRTPAVAGHWLRNCVCDEARRRKLERHLNMDGTVRVPMKPRYQLQPLDEDVELVWEEL